MENNYYIGYYNEEKLFVVRKVLEDFYNVSYEHPVIKEFISNDNEIDPDDYFRFKQSIAFDEIGIYFEINQNNERLRVKLVRILKLPSHSGVLKYLTTYEGKEYIKDVIFEHMESIND